MIATVLIGITTGFIFLVRAPLRIFTLPSAIEIWDPLIRGDTNSRFLPLTESLSWKR